MGALNDFRKRLDDCLRETGRPLDGFYTDEGGFRALYLDTARLLGAPPLEDVERWVKLVRAGSPFAIMGVKVGIIQVIDPPEPMATFHAHPVWEEMATMFSRGRPII